MTGWSGLTLDIFIICNNRNTILKQKPNFFKLGFCFFIPTLVSNLQANLRCLQYQRLTEPNRL